MNFRDHSLNEIKLENIFVIVIWYDASLFASSLQLQILNL